MNIENRIHPTIWHQEIDCYAGCQDSKRQGWRYAPVDGREHQITEHQAGQEPRHAVAREVIVRIGHPTLQKQCIEYHPSVNCRATDDQKEQKTEDMERIALQQPALQETTEAERPLADLRTVTQGQHKATEQKEKGNTTVTTRVQ